MWWVRRRVIMYSVLGLVAVDIAVGTSRDVWRGYEPGQYLECLDACRQPYSDLALVGSSVVVRGIDPRALNGLSWRGRTIKRACNLGLTMATATDLPQGEAPVREGG